MECTLSNMIKWPHVYLKYTSVSDCHENLSMDIFHNKMSTMGFCYVPSAKYSCWSLLFTTSMHPKNSYCWTEEGQSISSNRTWRGVHDVFVEEDKLHFNMCFQHGQCDLLIEVFLWTRYWKISLKWSQMEGDMVIDDKNWFSLVS